MFSTIFKICESSGFSIEVVVDNHEKIENIAVDWVGKNIFCTAGKSIHMFNYHGTMKANLKLEIHHGKNVTLDEPRGIALDPVMGE